MKTNLLLNILDDANRAGDRQVVDHHAIVLVPLHEASLKTTIVRGHIDQHASSCSQFPKHAGEDSVRKVTSSKELRGFLDIAQRPQFFDGAGTITRITSIKKLLLIIEI